VASIKLTYDNHDYHINIFDPSESIGLFGMFLAVDVKCQEAFRISWCDETCTTIAGNSTYLEKGKTSVIIYDMYPDESEGYPKQITIPNNAFAVILNTWLDDICKQRPKEVIIKHENDKFSIEMKN
jgi:hypothetical protein